MPAAQAFATECSIKRACSRAAPCAPRTGMSRLLAKPEIGALASTATATGSFACAAIAVPPRKVVRVGAEEECEAQPPHQNNGPHHAILFETSARCHHLLMQTQRPADALEALRQRHVLH